VVLLKSDQTWHRVPLPEERFSLVRAFGSFLAMSEARAKTPQAAESVGRPEWRKQAARTGPSHDEFLGDFGGAYVGRLHVYDVENNRTYTIVTNQGDSEVILVENGLVYYRVNDGLYSAPITANGVGTARLLATSDLIWDAHWAFVKH